MARNEHITRLFRRYLDGQHSDAELDELLEYFGLPEESVHLEALIAQEIKAAGDSTSDEQAILLAERIRKNLIRKTGRSSLGWAFVKIAALLLVFLSIGIVVYIQYFRESPSPSILVSKYGDDVLPGGNRAVLTLDDGRIIHLDEAKQEIIAGNDQLRYEDGAPLADVSGTEYVTLTTPNGGQYRMTLPDGSKVWLNASSSLTYPIRFAGKERSVEMSGEVLFEVVHDPDHPFTVSTAGQLVTVFGTSFNINAYRNEPVTATTLVSGSIKVHSQSNGQHSLLKPDQQAILEDGKITVKTVDATDLILWKSGIITLHYAKLPAIFRQIERWYDVEFIVNGSLPDDDLYGELQRDANLSEVLAVLEINTGVKFKIEGRRIMVSR